uniref:Ovule protein n=1 Tax=Haemonchus placei TaxID=6290 RepID=A0A0N4X1L0_HAEPC
LKKQQRFQNMITKMCRLMRQPNNWITNFGLSYSLTHINYSYSARDRLHIAHLRCRVG